MNQKLFSSILDGYCMNSLKDTKIPVVINYLENHDVDNRDFLIDLAIYSSDVLFMKRKYEGPLEDFNRLILDNKELLIAKLKEVNNYGDLRRLLARDFQLTTSIELFLVYKQIYQVDAVFMNDLIQTQYGNPTVPLSIFKHLPYESFYLDLEDANICKHIYGTFITVRVKAKKLEVICQIIGKTSDETNRPESEGYFGTHTCRVVLDCNDVSTSNTTDEDIQIDCDVSQFDEDDLHLNTILEAIYDNWPGSGLWDMCFMWYVIVPFLMYLNSDKSDIQDRPVRKSVQRRIKSNSASLTDQLKISEVGYVYGCSVRKYKKNNQKNTSHATKDVVSQTKRSHMRRAHWHRYRCGKNRQDVRLIWMPPMYIQGNSDSAVTIHKVQ